MSQSERLPLVYPVGHHASGKSKVSEHLIETHGFSIIETGAMVRAAYKEADPEQARFAHIGQFVKESEFNKPDFFIDLILSDIQHKTTSESPSGIIINGMRTPTHLKRVQAKTELHPQGIVWIESPRDTLKSRWEIREGRRLTDEEFDELLLFDSQLGLDQIRPIADIDVINDGSLEQLNNRVENALYKLGVLATARCQQFRDYGYDL